jgi:NAD(P)-dependent dehydrogenase (short-subunit alcohol dehydrogenase family)
VIRSALTQDFELLLFRPLKHEIRSMKAIGGGAIVNIGSNIGARIVRPTLGAYAASKAAVSSLTRTAALEAIAHSVRINCLCPGPVDTPLSMRPGEDRAARDARVAATPTFDHVCRHRPWCTSVADESDF